ncbi:MFS transporter [Bifidobacterium simiarum]|uniref:MFS transporter n=1 Tax=Bifidobacterium simiarum TaxID=2045441 RepID=A0A2M9HD16_9BIFI|nr:MFS transporter [Bifidobacterium simiarum]MBT1167229.1 MFS transporter [Bifidobacterium simiarum]PJM74686.1 MFS transporter [Bifidobacterium simiarum]
MANTEKLDKRYWKLARNAGIASYLDAALLVSAGVALPLWQSHFSLSPWWAGAVSTILTLSVAVGSFFGGRLSDRFGRTVVFNIDILFVVVGAAIIAFAPNLTVLLVGIIIAGLASGADLPTSLAVISERVPREHQGRVVSSTEIFWIAAIVISQGIGFLVSGLDMTGVTIMFLVIAAVALITWLVRVASPSFKKIEEDLAAEFAHTQVDAHSTDAQQAYPLGQLLKNPRYLIPLIGLAGFYLFWNLPANTWGSFLNYYLVTIGGRSQSFATAAGFFANILGCLVLYGIYIRLADTRHRYSMMHVGLILCIAAMAVSAFAGGTWMIFTVCYFVYCTANMLHGEPLYKVWSQELFPVNARATATGFTYAVVRFITAIFGFVTPALMAVSPNLLLWILVASLCLSYASAFGIMKFIKGRGIPDPALNPAAVEAVESAETR